MDYYDLFETRINGNLSEYKKELKKMSKDEIVGFILFLRENSHNYWIAEIEKIRDYLKEKGD